VGSVCGFSAAVGPDGHVYLNGELDIAGLDALRAALEQAVLGPGDLLVIDIAGLSFIDSSAISELLRYQLTATSSRRRLCLTAVPDHIGQILDILDLRDLLVLADDEPGTPQAKTRPSIRTDATP
jgi:anti-anti-sigma factor